MFLKEFFENNHFEKSQQITTKEALEMLYVHTYSSRDRLITACADLTKTPLIISYPLVQKVTDEA